MATRLPMSMTARARGYGTETDEVAAPRGSSGGETRVLLVSRQRLFRDCLANQLAGADGFVVAGRVEDVGQGIVEARSSGADVLVVDGSGLDDVGYDLLAGLDGAPKAVVLGMRGVVSEVRRCADAGIDGFAYRDLPLNELVRTLGAVVRGERVCGPASARELFSRLSRLGRRERQGERLDALSLTPRQMEVLRLIARGLGNEQIAERLGLSPHTIKNHVHNILDRLEARDRAEAVAHAYQRHWLP